MKKDISIIRDSISKIVNLLTNKAIKVTQRGARAFVEYDARSGAIKSVNLPYLPDDASEEFIAAVQGFLDHEVGHVLFTDQKLIKTVATKSTKVKNLANALEDVYIERKMTAAFAGSATNLDSVRRFYLERIAKPKIEAAMAAGNLKEAAGYAGLIQFRAWGGQTMAQDFLDDHPELAELNKPMAEKLGPDMIARIKKCNSTKDCLALAEDMERALKEPTLDESAGTPEPDEDGGEGKGDDKSPEPSAKPETTPDDASAGAEPDEDEDKPDPIDEGTVSAETDDSGKERDERSETEEDVSPEAGDAGGEDAGDREPDEGDASKSDAEGGEDEMEDGPPPEDELDDGMTIEGEGKTDDGDEEPGEDGPSSSEPSDDGEVSDEPGDDAPSAKGTDDRDTAEAEPDLSELFDKERDFDDDVSKTLGEVAREEISKSDYQIFSTDWDVIEPAPMAERDVSIERMVDTTRHMVSGIQKTLERAIAAKARKSWNPGQRRGKVNPGALFRTSVGDDRIFRQRFETHAKNTAVSLLVDCSGSMRGADKIGVAGMAAFALASTLERLKIQHEVIGFTTRQSGPMVRAMSSEGMGLRYARNEAIYMPVFKGYGERLTVEAKSRIAHLTESPSWLRENVDGECLRIAAHRLKMQRAERHLLIVLSDGSPACPGDYSQLQSHLKTTARELEKDSGVEVIGIGIMDGSVRHFYDKHLVLSNLADLPTTVVAELSKVLLAK